MNATDSDDPAASEGREADVADGSTRPVAALRPHFELSLQSPRAAVAPGGRASLHLRIRNVDDSTARYQLSLDGIPASWVLLDPLTAPVAPGASTTQTVLLHPARHPGFPPGPHLLCLRVEPQYAPQAALEQEFTLQLLPGSGFGMALAQEGNDLQLLLQNQGNAPLSLQLGVLAPTGAAAPTLSPEPITLAAGEQRSIPLRLRAVHRPLLGRSRTLEFTIEAHALDEAGFVVALPAQLLVVPRLNQRVISLALALLLALALFVLRPVTPVILEFYADPPQLLRGDSLELGWQVRDAAALQLSLDGQALARQPEPQQSGYRLETDALAGEVTLQLEARNGDRRASQSLTVLIREPLQVQAFSASPPQLLRHVVQTLTLRWEVPGAQQVRIEGLTQVISGPIEAGSARDGLEGLPVLVAEELTLTLTAMDDAGNVLQRTLTIPAIAATCSVAQAALPLRAEPQADAASLLLLESDSPVEVDGRDPGGDWLQLQAQGVTGWALREGLVCADFEPQDLRILQPGVG